MRLSAQSRSTQDAKLFYGVRLHLKCSDNSYYVGSTTSIERRLWEHQTGFFKGYTSNRLPVQLVWSSEFPSQHEALLFERQIKGWSRAKKEALIRGDWDGIHMIVKQERRKREFNKRHPSTPSANPSTLLRSAQDTADSAQDTADSAQDDEHKP